MPTLLQTLLTTLRRIVAPPRNENVVPRPSTFRNRQVPAAASRSRVRLQLISDGTRAGTDTKFGALLGASLGTVVVAGFASPALGQSDEACSFVLQLRSPYTVERILEQFPNDPCIPVMLTSISPQLLSRLSPAKIMALPASQLRQIPQEILAKLGIGLARTRNVPGTNPTTTYTNNNTPY